MLTQERLKELFHYNPETGEFTRLQKSCGVLPGTIAGWTENTGYVRIKIQGKSYVAHRLAWLYMTGELPAKQIDHINLIRSDNRWVNLRSASASENKCNSKPNAGVYKTPSNRYQSEIKKEGKRFYLGTFDTREEAKAAYNAAALRLHGEFSCVS